MDINFFKLGSADDIAGGCYFRQSTAPEDAEAVIVSAPWSVTAGDNAGATYAPDAVIEASAATPLYDMASGEALNGRIATADIDYDIQEWSQQLNSDAEKVLSAVADGDSTTGDYLQRRITRINDGNRRMRGSVAHEVGKWLDKGKAVGVVGGSHSVSVGAIHAVANRNAGVGVLVLDAHCDLLDAEQSIFEYTHRSVMRNVVESVPDLGPIAIVGVREAARSEIEFAEKHKGITVYAADRLTAERFDGCTWAEQCRRIIGLLPAKVYISVDVDALSADCFPHTGAPVAGGMTFGETVYLLNAVAAEREIVAFDLTEIVPRLESGIDAKMGAQLLARLCGAMLKSKKTLTK